MSTFRTITENTLIPVSLVIVLAGGILWLTTIQSQGEVNTVSIQEIKDRREEDVGRIDRRLERIESKLDTLIEKGN